MTSGLLLSRSASTLQAELSRVFALRKRLEWDVLSYQHLRKALEEQIGEIRRREGTGSPVCVSPWRLPPRAVAEPGRSPQASVGDGAAWGFRLGRLFLQGQCCCYSSGPDSGSFGRWRPGPSTLR